LAIHDPLLADAEAGDACSRVEVQPHVLQQVCRQTVHFPRVDRDHPEAAAERPPPEKDVLGY